MDNRDIKTGSLSFLFMLVLGLIFTVWGKDTYARDYSLRSIDNQNYQHHQNELMRQQQLILQQQIIQQQNLNNIRRDAEDRAFHRDHSPDLQFNHNYRH